jgi:hypothetical protein
MRKRKAIAAVAIACVVFAIVFSACEVKKISQIKAEPDRYFTREVGISGKVVRSFSILGRGAYEVDDGTGRLWVISGKGVPRAGAEVVARGKIKDGFDLGSVVKLPDIVSSGIVLIESEHRAR